MLLLLRATVAPSFISNHPPSNSGIALNSIQLLDGVTRAELFAVNPPNSGRLFGNILRLLPDMNGDGKEEWLIHQLDFLSSVGRVFIFDSQTRRQLRVIENSEAAYRFYLQNMEVLPDVNGDGKPELLAGGHSATITRDGATMNAGRVVVRSSETGKVLYELHDPEPQHDGGFGLELESIGDVTRDGIGDIAVGTHFKDSGTGAIYFFSGADGRWLRTLRSPEPASSQRFGRRIEVLPDLNEDGVPELLTQEDGVRRTYLYDGLTSILLKTDEHFSPVGGFILVGTVRQQAPPGVRAYLFAAPLAESSGRVYYVPFTGLPKRAHLTALAKTATGFRLRIAGEPGHRFEIQVTRDFITWEPADTVNLIARDPLLIDDTAAGNQQRRFYRAAQMQ